MTWPSGVGVTADAAFRSLCIMQKEAVCPVTLLGRMWRTNRAATTKIVAKLSNSCLVSRSSCGITAHSLVLDYSLNLGSESEQAFWHGRVLSGYEREVRKGAQGRQLFGSRDSNEVCAWWNVCSSAAFPEPEFSYFVNHLARHLALAGRYMDVLSLLVDYRWIEFVNQYTSQAPFVKLISDLQLLNRHLKGFEKNPKKALSLLQQVASQVSLLIESLQRCVPVTVRNRGECAFQLYGRLCDLSQHPVIETCLWSIRSFAERPWALPSPRALRSAGDHLKRVLRLEHGTCCFELCPKRDDILACDAAGKLIIVDSWTGQLKGGTKGFSRCFVEPCDSVASTSCEGAAILYCGDLNKVVTASRFQQSFMVWNQGLELEWRVPLEEEHVTCAVYLGAGRVAFGTRLGNIIVYHITNFFRLEGISTGHAGLVEALAVSGDAQLMASGSTDHTVRLWSTCHGSLEFKKVLRGHEEAVSDVAVSIDGRFVASASQDKSIIIWNVKSGRIYHHMTGHTGPVYSVVFSQDGTSLFSAGGDNIVSTNAGNGIRKWDVTSGKTVSKMRLANEDRTALLKLSPDGLELFSDCAPKTIAVWRPEQAESSHKSSARNLNLCGVERFVVTADGSTVWTAGPVDCRRRQGDVKAFRAWDAESLVEDSSKFFTQAGCGLFVMNASSQVLVTTSDNGCSLYLRKPDGTVERLTEHERERDARAAQNATGAIVFSELSLVLDGTRLAAEGRTSSGLEIHVAYNAVTGEFIKKSEVNTSGVADIVDNNRSCESAKSKSEADNSSGKCICCCPGQAKNSADIDISDMPKCEAEQRSFDSAESTGQSYYSGSSEKDSGEGRGQSYYSGSSENDSGESRGQSYYSGSSENDIPMDLLRDPVPPSCRTDSDAGSVSDSASGDFYNEYIPEPTSESYLEDLFGPRLTIRDGALQVSQKPEAEKIVATLDHRPMEIRFNEPTKKMWIRDVGQKLYYIKLIDSTYEEEGEKPELPTLPNAITSRSIQGYRGVSPDQFAAFISHAGPDKVSFASPLYERILSKMLNRRTPGKVFFDREELNLGDHTHQKMTRAMNEAKVAVIVLSPEFIARRWPMRELACFIDRRDEGEEILIIPVFLRLSVHECRDENIYKAQFKDRDGDNLFVKEKFFREDRQKEMSTSSAKGYLRKLAIYAGAGEKKREDQIEEEIERVSTRAAEWYQQYVDSRRE